MLVSFQRVEAQNKKEKLDGISALTQIPSYQ
ncbi:hypothetical protein ABIB30_000519 [Pedobacter sp. UYP1]|jgi:hypothetical protein